MAAAKWWRPLIKERQAAMAKLKCATHFIEQMIFGYSANPVLIKDVSYDPIHRIVEFEIEGDDVPDASEVQAVCSDFSNRAGQRLITMTFQAVE